MAKKVETISLIDTFSEFKELKNIDRTTMVSVLEESFRSVIAKMFGTDENYDVIVNPDKGDFEIWRNREVVADEDLENPNLQIALSEAQKIDASYEVGEEVTDEVIFANFGRRAILNLRQTLASKILELEKDSIYNKYIDKVGNIINAEVYQIWKKEMLLLDDEGNELLLPKTEQIPSDFYRKGETARAVVARVDNKNNNPKIILSRTSPVFLQRLFEMEVPEINDGLITIKKIARIPGERAKIGSNVFACTYAEFIIARTVEMIRQNLSYHQFNVKLIGNSAGFAMETLAVSHWATEDIALVRALPNIIILSASDCLAAIKLVIAASLIKGPVYVRLSGGLNCPIVYEKDCDFTIGKSNIIKKGEDVAILATGLMVREAMDAAEMLKEKNINATVAGFGK